MKFKHAEPAGTRMTTALVGRVVQGKRSCRNEEVPIPYYQPSAEAVEFTRRRGESRMKAVDVGLLLGIEPSWVSSIEDGVLIPHSWEDLFKLVFEREEE